MSSLLERVREALPPEYLVERALGEGGMGVVFRARDIGLARVVAIKVLRPELATATAVARFAREAQFQANLSRKHPNIIQVYHAADRDGLSFYVMEYLEGDTLRSRLEAGPLGARAVRGLGRALLDALAAAHRSQIVHRDIKPANVFLAGDRTVLTDFGVAHTDASDTTLTTPGQLIGTRRYMAPEQLVGKPATALSDLYAVGAVLYEACTGRRWLQTTAAQQGDWSAIPGWLAAALRPPSRSTPTSAGSRRSNFATRSMYGPRACPSWWACPSACS
jgi:serine/threonine protein kinase